MSATYQTLGPLWQETWLLNVCSFLTDRERQLEFIAFNWIPLVTSFHDGKKKSIKTPTGISPTCCIIHFCCSSACLVISVSPFWLFSTYLKENSNLSYVHTPCPDESLQVNNTRLTKHSDQTQPEMIGHD